MPKLQFYDTNCNFNFWLLGFKLEFCKANKYIRLKMLSSIQVVLLKIYHFLGGVSNYFELKSKQLLHFRFLLFEQILHASMKKIIISSLTLLPTLIISENKNWWWEKWSSINTLKWNLPKGPKKILLNGWGLC